MSQQSATSLCSLPRELVDNILSFMKHPTDISSLSMVSKNMRTIAIEALFGDISMGWKCKRAESGGLNYHQTDTPRIDLLLRTLIETPSLADKVTKINLQLRGFKSSRSGQLPPRVQLPRMTYATSYRCAVRVAMAQVCSDGQNLTDDLIRGVFDNQFEAVVAAMLLVCTRLTVVVLDSNVFRRNNFLGPILHHILPNPHIKFFKHLRTFRLGKCLLPSEDTIDRPSRYYPRDSLELLSYLPLFYIQGLQDAELCLPELTTGARFEWPTPIAPTLSALHTLKLPECRLMPRALHNILSTTPNLQHLECAFWMPEWGIFDAAAFSVALGSVKNTLQHLKVTLLHWEDHDFDPKGFSVDLDWVEGHCSLKHLLHLKTLSISSCVLFGWHFDEAPALLDVLPPQIISLALTDDEFSWYQQDFWWYEEKLFTKFQTLFAHQDWKTMLPHMRQIYIDYCDWEKETTLHRMCEENGLTFKLIYTW